MSGDVFPLLAVRMRFAMPGITTNPSGTTTTKSRQRLINSAASPVSVVHVASAGLQVRSPTLAPQDRFPRMESCSPLRQCRLPTPRSLAISPRQASQRLLRIALPMTRDRSNARRLPREICAREDAGESNMQVRKNRQRHDDCTNRARRSETNHRHCDCQPKHSHGANHRSFHD